MRHTFKERGGGPYSEGEKMEAYRKRTLRGILEACFQAGGDLGVMLIH